MKKKIEIELSEVDYRLIDATATYVKQSIEAYCREVIMKSACLDLKGIVNQLEDRANFIPKSHSKFPDK